MAETVDNAKADTDPSKLLLKAAEKCKTRRDDLKDDWVINVDYRRGAPFSSDSEDDRVYVNIDASMTRRKVTQLASQVPEARLSTEDDRVRPVLGQFAQRVNKEVRKAGTGDAMFEAACDAVNAAGFGWALVGYEARTVPKDVPAMDPMSLSPEQQEALAATESGELEPEHAKELLATFGVPMKTIDHPVSSRFYARRGSPTDLLWPLEFERSNFDFAPWMGHSGRMSWGDAMASLGLTEEDKETVCGDQLKNRESLRDDKTDESNDEHLVVEYDELFYYRAYFDPAETHYDCIYRIVFVKGKDKPTVHEPWKGQKRTEDGSYVGAMKLPIRVLTLDYVSDDPLPPSDSAIARPQVNELIRSRTQMILQRERALPARWHDINRVDPTISQNLMKGHWQGSIPVKGNGNSIIGEVARASYPPESFEFDRTIKQDIQESWQAGENQMGMMSRGRRSAAEANIAQSNFSTQMGFQRARVGAFFVGIAEIIAGLLVLHGQGLPLPAEAPGQPPMDVSQMAGAFDYSILPDTTMMLDANQRADQIMEFLNMTGKSGFVNPKPLIEEIARLKGIDPAQILIDPKPPEPEEPKIAFSFRGMQDLHDPIVLATLMEGGHAPSPDSIDGALKLLETINAKMGFGGVPPPLPPAPEDAGGPPPVVDDSNPGWNTLSQVRKRSASEG